MSAANPLLAALARVAEADEGPDRARAAAQVMEALLAYGSATPDNVAAAGLVAYEVARGFVLVGDGRPLGDVLRAGAAPQAGRGLVDECAEADAAMVAHVIAGAEVALAAARADAGQPVTGLLHQLATRAPAPAPLTAAHARRLDAAFDSAGRAVLGRPRPARCRFDAVDDGTWETQALTVECGDLVLRLGDLVNALDGADRDDWRAAQRVATLVCLGLGVRRYLGA